MLKGSKKWQNNYRTNIWVKALNFRKINLQVFHAARTIILMAQVEASHPHAQMQQRLSYSPSKMEIKI